MANILIMAPFPMAAIVASRGSGAANLMTPSPKEVWVDNAVGTAVTIDIDIGWVTNINTVLLGHLTNAAAGATWTITGGTAGYTTTMIKAAGALRVADGPTFNAAMSHAFWTGAAVSVRYLRISVTQPAGSTPLAAGVVCVGAAFQPTWNKEWGGGRGVIDTGTVTPLPDGGFAVVPGARKGSYSWTLSDLTDDEVENLYAIALYVGETSPVLVVEDPASATLIRNRIHYARFKGLREFARRDVSLNRWELAVEDWA